MSDRYDEPRRDDEHSRLDFDPQSSPDDDALEAAS